MYDSKNVAIRIKEIAKTENLELKQIFDRCDLNKNTITNLYKGHFIKLDSIAKIADELNCSIDYLTGRTDNKEVNK